MPNKRVNERLVLEGLPIIYKNFSGNKTAFNAQGDRNFSLVIEDEALAMKLESLGWTPRLMKKREEEEEDRWQLPVKVSYEGSRPLVYKIGAAGKLALTEETIDMLDYIRIKYVDVELNPYNWNFNGNVGVKAYLNKLYAHADETPLDLKYSDIPDVGG